jgi:hypothetical protein
MNVIELIIEAMTAIFADSFIMKRFKKKHKNADRNNK